MPTFCRPYRDSDDLKHRIIEPGKYIFMGERNQNS